MARAALMGAGGPRGFVGPRKPIGPLPVGSLWLDWAACKLYIWQGDRWASMFM
jgi:hypothetical protein